MSFADADRTQATAPLSPFATPPRDVYGRAPTHSTPANRRANVVQPADDEPASVGYRGHPEGEEVDQTEPGGSRDVRSRVSLQARGSNSRAEPPSPGRSSQFS